VCLLKSLKGYLGNWPHYYRVVLRSKLVFYNVLTTSINNSRKKRKNLKTIYSSETISSRIFGSAPNSPNTRCHLFDLVGLTSLWHSHRRVHSAGSTFTFFKHANCTHVACHVCTTRYLGNAMQRRFSISALHVGSVYDVAQTNLWRSLWTKFTSMVKYETPWSRDWLLIGDFLFPREVSWINTLRALKWEKQHFYS
jgi:hypothetical protein